MEVNVCCSVSAPTCRTCRKSPRRPTMRTLEPRNLPLAALLKRRQGEHAVSCLAGKRISEICFLALSVIAWSQWSLLDEVVFPGKCIKKSCAGNIWYGNGGCLCGSSVDITLYTWGWYGVRLRRYKAAGYRMNKLYRYIVSETRWICLLPGLFLWL